MTRFRSALEGELLAERRRWGDVPLPARALADLLGHPSAQVAAVLVRLVDDRRVVEMERGPLAGYTLPPGERQPSFRILDSDDWGRPTLFACDGCRTTWPSAPDNRELVLVELTAHRCEGEPCRR